MQAQKHSRQVGVKALEKFKAAISHRIQKEYYYQDTLQPLLIGSRTLIREAAIDPRSSEC